VNMVRMLAVAFSRYVSVMFSVVVLARSLVRGRNVLWRRCGGARRLAGGKGQGCDLTILFLVLPRNEIPPTETNERHG
jgi:hypothetical protein